MNRKNTFKINSRGETVDVYGRVFSLDTVNLAVRKRRKKDVYPAPNAMRLAELKEVWGSERDSSDLWEDLRAELL